MEARIKSPVATIPGAMHALLALAKTVQGQGVPSETLALVHLRASQINGCGVCVDMHAHALGTTEEAVNRALAVSAWRDTSYFTDPERAALALAESVTRLSDSPDPVPDDVWNEAARYYDERALGALLLGIATINVWNRLNVSTRQVAGAWTRSAAKQWAEAEAR